MKKFFATLFLLLTISIMSITANAKEVEIISQEDIQNANHICRNEADDNVCATVTVNSDMFTVQRFESTGRSVIYEEYGFVPNMDTLLDEMRSYAITHLNQTGKTMSWVAISFDDTAKLYVFNGNQSYIDMYNCMKETNYDWMVFGSFVDQMGLQARIEQLEKVKDYPVYATITEQSMFPILEVSVYRYIIKPGDTLSEIAAQYTTSVNHLLDLNPYIKDPNRIYIGDTLIVK